MLRLALRNLIRRPLRNGLTLAGLALAVAVLACLSAFGAGYRRALGTELDRMGLQLMLVPLGCPYDAAARVLKGNTLENSLPQSALDEARRDPAVALAAPMLIAAVPKIREGRTDLWVGLDEASRILKPWWKVKSGTDWFLDSESLILGVETAAAEMRSPGDKFFSPETQKTFRVTGVLERNGTSDDSLFFIPLETAQRMFHQPGRLTAVAIRLRDPEMLREASERLQRIPGAQVVTLTEMMGTFLNLVGSVRTLLQAIAVLAVTVSALGAFNTFLAAVIERSNELALLRAVGASRAQIFRLISTEALLLSTSGGAAGLLMALGLGRWFEQIVRQIVPFAPTASLLEFDAAMAGRCLALGVIAGLLAGIYPAWKASRAQPAQSFNFE